MTKIGNYKILASSNFVVEYYSGEINADDFIHFKNIINLEKEYDFCFDTIIDVRDSYLTLSNDDLKKIDIFLKNKFEILKTRNVVYLTCSPDHVVQSVLFARTVKENSMMSMNQQVFSTVETAVNWFNNEKIDSKLVIAIIDDLKESSFNVFEQKLP